MIKASVAKQGRKPPAARPPAKAVTKPRVREPQKTTSTVNPYIQSMQDVMEKKRGNGSRNGSGRGAGHKTKATGVTRRLMEEVAVARENMHLFNRLISVLPSSDVERRRLLKDFSKSRIHLEKMSRFASTAVENGRSQHPKPAWDDNWVGCMV